MKKSTLTIKATRARQEFYCQKFLETTQLDYTMAGHTTRARWGLNYKQV